MTILKKAIIFFSIILIFASCKDDDDMKQSNNFTVTIENVVTPTSFFESGTVAIPQGAVDPAPLFPGDIYNFTINAGTNVTPMDGGTRFSFVTMFVQSNDLFFAPDESGIELYDNAGTPLGDGSVVDITDQVLLWDAGTEVNEMTGSASQKPQQDPMASDVGTDENGVVSQIMGNSDGVNTLPNVNEVMRLTVQYIEPSQFVFNIENVSDGMTIATPAMGAGTTAAVPISPIVYAVHTSDNPFFKVGEAASTGVEDIAEDGFIDVESARVADNTGLIVPLSPGVWAVHENGVNPIFVSGTQDFGEGLEGIAEDGDPTNAATALGGKEGVMTSGFFNTPIGASSPAAIGPGASYSFNFTAESGEKLSLATMFVQSNDWFYSFGEDGIELYNGDNPISGDVSSSLFLYDSGTEIDEYPGAGPNQVIRQSAGNTGAIDSDQTVRRVNNPPANVPSVDQVIKVTITNQ